MLEKVTSQSSCMETMLDSRKAKKTNKRITAETFDVSFWVITEVYFKVIAEVAEVYFLKRRVGRVAHGVDIKLFLWTDFVKIWE